MKKMIKAAIVGLSMFGMVGGASAADVNINITGASAQFKYWNDAAEQFLVDKGCSNIKVAEGSSTYGTKKSGITKGDCGADTWYIRYTARASIDGIRSMKGLDPDSTSSCTDKRQRELADETPSTVPANGGTNWTTGEVYSLTCKTINIGASDVEAAAFKQKSYGAIDGHLGGTTVYWDVNNVDDSGLNNYRPIVVPFAFFAHDDVPFDNISKMMAVHIFSGQVDDWADFGAASSLPIVRCLRHAGSGTHATLHGTVMDGAGTLLWREGANTYFYESSSDLILGPANLSGAIGYADADKHLDDNGVSEYPNIKRLTYQGFDATHDNIVAGVYPFWAAQWLYVLPTVTDTDPEGELALWAAQAANMPTARQNYWAAQSEMSTERDDTFSFPVIK